MKLATKLWRSEGPEEAKILLLHGMGGTGQLWRPIAATLESRFSLLAPDQRGHGGSRPAPSATDPAHVTPQEYGPLEYGKDVVETLEAENFHPAWVVGHSMGVRTACALAHLKPEWVKGLVLIDLGLYGPAGGGLGEGLATFLKDMPMHFESRVAAREYMAKNCPDPSIAQYLMAVSVPAPGATLQGGPVTFPFDKESLIATIQAAENISLREWVAEAAARGIAILLLRGATSQVWTKPEFEEERARFKDQPKIQFEEFEGTGHGLPFEKRAQFTARLVRLIETGK